MSPAIDAIDSLDRPQVKLLDRIQDKPHEVIGRQPVPQARRQQQLLLAITMKFCAIPGRLLNPPDDTTVYATGSGERESEVLDGRNTGRLPTH